MISSMKKIVLLMFVLLVPTVSMYCIDIEDMRRINKVVEK